jgi:hypothetical protein
MRGAQKQILVLVLTVASLAIFARLIQSFEEKPAPLEDFVFSQRPKLGFTIWGIQPGDSVPEILREIPPNTKAELTERLRGRDILLHGPSDRTLQLTTVETDGSEVVEEVRVDSVQYETTLELHGKPILRGRTLSVDDIQAALPGARRIREGFVAIKFGHRVDLGYEGHRCLSSMELTLVDTAPLESE